MDDSPWMPPGSNPEGGTAAAPQPAGPLPAPGTPPAAAPVGQSEPTLPVPTLPAPTPPAPTPPPPPASPWSAAAPEAPAPILPPVAPAAPAAPAAAAFAPLTDDPVAEPGDVTVAPAGRSGRSKLIVGAAVAAVVAVGAAGVFAVRGFSGEAQGGAADPEALGAALMASLENEDVLGVIDVLSPGERDLFRQPAIDLVSELTRIEVLSPEADLSRLAGFDIVFENEVVTVAGTNVDDIVNVRMQAQAEVTVDGDLVPVGSLVTDNLDASMVDEMRATSETTQEPFDVDLTAVQLDGRWYFSVFHSIAEQLREDEGQDLSIPLAGVGAAGAESPEAAVDQMLDAVEGLDLELMMQSLNPGEAAALQRYAPLFLGEAQAALDEIPLEWQITTREFRVEGDGSQRTVFLDALAIEGSVEDESFSIGFEGDCVSAEFLGETYEQCATDATQAQLDELDEILAEAPAVREFVTALEETFADMEPVGLELREFEGGWYVSPVSTVSEAMLTFLRALDRQEIDRLIDLGEAAVEDVLGLALGGFGGDLFTDDEFGMGDTAVFESMTDPTFETAFDSMESGMESGMDDGMDDTYVAPAWDRCYAELDVAAAASCFQTFVDSGEIDEFVVPVELRFPECGLGARWTRDLYTMEDAEFIATIEAAMPCFQALVDAGTIEAFEMPTEIVYSDCYEGRNWYNVFDDPEYDERYWACVDSLFAD